MKKPILCLATAVTGAVLAIAAREDAHYLRPIDPTPDESGLHDHVLVDFEPFEVFEWEVSVDLQNWLAGGTQQADDAGEWIFFSTLGPRLFHRFREAAEGAPLGGGIPPSLRADLSVYKRLQASDLRHHRNLSRQLALHDLRPHAPGGRSRACKASRDAVERVGTDRHGRRSDA